MQIDYKKVRETAEKYGPDMNRFLRDLIKLKGESSEEGDKSRRIKEEMEKLGYDKVEINGQGSVIGYMGHGPRLLAFDGHIDTVGIGNRDNWEFDPYDGFEDENLIGGRGCADQLGGIVSATYGAKVMKDCDLLTDEFTMMVSGTVQEEDCDGNCWLYITEVDKIEPEFVLTTEPSDGGIYRGHRGRMEIRVDVSGISCHGSAPERGENAIYKMAEILLDIKALNDNPADDPHIKGLAKMLLEENNPEYKEANFLGKGTVTCSEIYFTSPSRCAVADSCAISLDRRMTAGETWESCLKEIEALPACQKYGAKATMYNYHKESWTGVAYDQECYFPAWTVPEDHPALLATIESYKELYGEKRIAPNVEKEIEKRKDLPLVDKYTFSTNCVAIMGRHKIPCVGFGPGAEDQAHAPNEVQFKQDLVTCAAVYAAIPKLYCEKYNKK